MGLKSHFAFDTFDTYINFSHEVYDKQEPYIIYVYTCLYTHTHSHPFTEQHSINSDCSARFQVLS